MFGEPPSPQHLKRQESYKNFLRLQVNAHNSYHLVKYILKKSDYSKSKSALLTKDLIQSLSRSVHGTSTEDYMLLSLRFLPYIRNAFKSDAISSWLR